MNPGCSYLRDILYAGPLSPSTELSTFLRKHAPAAPKCTDRLQNPQNQKVRFSECPTPYNKSTPESSQNYGLLKRWVAIVTALPLVINLFMTHNLLNCSSGGYFCYLLFLLMANLALKRTLIAMLFTKHSCGKRRIRSYVSGRDPCAHGRLVTPSGSKFTTAVQKYQLLSWWSITFGAKKHQTRQ